MSRGVGVFITVPAIDLAMVGDGLEPLRHSRSFNERFIGGAPKLTVPSFGIHN